MKDAFVFGAVLHYLSAFGIYLFRLFRGGGRKAIWARSLLSVAFVLHASSLGLQVLQQGLVQLSSIQAILQILSLLLIGMFALAMLRYPLDTLGAFVTPLALLFLLAGELGTKTPNPSIFSLSFIVHLGLNIAGLVAFAFASVLSLAYLIQEALLKRKHLGGVLGRLPPLDVLDSLSLRMISVGFPLLTLGIVTGMLWAWRMARSATVSSGQAFAFVSWLVFAAVLLLRSAAGWRGRRAAQGAILGFLCAMMVLVGYVVRALK